MARHGEYSTLITCGFVHADMFHLLFNAITLYFFGPALERTIGTLHFLVLYFAALLVSSIGTVIRNRRNPDYASLGASGAINGVLFAFIVYYPLVNIYLFFAIPIPAALYAVAFLAYSMWASKHSRDRINHDAHLDGAIVGLLYIAITDPGVWGDAFSQLFGGFG